MPSPRKILILSLTSRSRTSSHIGRLFWQSLGPLHIQLLLRLLRALGFRFKTVSQALAESSGRFACLTFDVADEHLLSEILPSLDTMKAPATVFVPTTPVQGQLNWGALKALMLKGWEIGSLGHEAVDLTERSYSDQRRFISQAKAQLTELIGMAPKLFAYPFGAYDATTVSCVRDAGFAAALTLRRGINDLEADHGAFHLRRIPLSGALLRDLLLIGKTAFSSSNHLQPPVIRQPNRDGIQSTGSGL